MINNWYFYFQFIRFIKYSLDNNMCNDGYLIFWGENFLLCILITYISNTNFKFNLIIYLLKVIDFLI